MSKKTVRQLADIVKIPLERLLVQLKEAGVHATKAEDEITEDEKTKLLAHLRSRHGKAGSETENAPSRVTLKRRKVTELKQASVPGSATKTISIEVRKEKTYIKREQPAVEKTVETPVEKTEVKAEPVVETVVQKPVEKAPVIETKAVEEKAPPVVEVKAVEEETTPVVETKPAPTTEKPHKDHHKPKKPVVIDDDFEE
ncbi:MAG: translation initiation factor IF-2 associated domain-containing protein, partial [Methylococcales bacterium]|nr:translation initiation factor IF-2 associated domain-containing protein [Methylococcales bacterium]